MAPEKLLWCFTARSQLELNGQDYQNLSNAHFGAFANLFGSGRTNLRTLRRPRFRGLEKDDCSCLAVFTNCLFCVSDPRRRPRETSRVVFFSHSSNIGPLADFASRRQLYKHMATTRVLFFDILYESLSASRSTPHCALREVPRCATF